MQNLTRQNNRAFNPSFEGVSNMFDEVEKELSELSLKKHKHSFNDLANNKVGQWMQMVEGVKCVLLKRLKNLLVFQYVIEPGATIPAHVNDDAIEEIKIIEGSLYELKTGAEITNKITIPQNKEHQITNRSKIKSVAEFIIKRI